VLPLVFGWNGFFFGAGYWFTPVRFQGHLFLCTSAPPPDVSASVCNAGETQRVSHFQRLRASDRRATVFETQRTPYRLRQCALRWPPRCESCYVPIAFHSRSSVDRLQFPIRTWLAWHLCHKNCVCATYNTFSPRRTPALVVSSSTQCATLDQRCPGKFVTRDTSLAHFTSDGTSLRPTLLPDRVVFRNVSSAPPSCFCNRRQNEPTNTALCKFPL
jgi:hypothetical protein